MTRFVATVIAALLALSPVPVSGTSKVAGAHDCCADQMATAPCDRTVQALPCCGTPVPAPVAMTGGVVSLGAPRVTCQWGLGMERPPESAAQVSAAAAHGRRQAASPPPPYLLHRVLRI